MVKNKKTIKVASGVCPHCGKNELEYGISEHENNTLTFPWICSNCKKEGIEEYSVKFEGHTIGDENGKTFYYVGEEVENDE